MFISNILFKFKNIFKIERIKWKEFIETINFLKFFPKIKIDKFCSQLKGKFLS